MSVIHVAVGVIRNRENQILIARRPSHVHLGGLWEFPGGKVENNETVQQALQRELKEELNISFNPDNSYPLIKITHQYAEKKVLLDVWVVSDIQGKVYGCEQQETKWVMVDELHQFDFPEANKTIVTALMFPQRYLITGDFSSQDEFDQRLNSALKIGIKLVQLRAKRLTDKEYLALAEHTLTICQQQGAKLILNSEAELIKAVDVDGIHLTASRLMQLQTRPITKHKYLMASCHNESEIQQAAKIGVDAIVLGPVKNTVTHAQAIAMGWERFSELVELASVPVFALGGLKEIDFQTAQKCGAQGIAGISAWW